MRKRFTTFIILFVASMSVLSVTCFAQEKLDAYKAENDGYFTHLASTVEGIVFTDNSGSAIYLLKENKFEKLLDIPGCGRYYTISSDKSKIGYKKINADGMQLPAVYDLATEEISELSNPVDLCGQVSFSNNGTVAYTIGNILYVNKDNNFKTFDLGVYSNITPISPDGICVIYNNDNDQLFVLELFSNQSKQITDNIGGYCLPQWSPDGTKILFSALSGILKVFNCKTEAIYTIGKGENASWTDNENIIFNKTETDNFEYKGSDIFISNFNGSKIINLTNTPDINEISPVLIDNNILVYSTFEKREIISAAFNPTTLSLSNKTVLANSISSLTMLNYSSGNTQKIAKANTVVQGDVPYVNQKWDTPDWHAGGGSCAPTTAIMALAYYNRLPYWDITCSSPTSHVSHYGSYVADKYRYNEIYYDAYADAYGTDAYGGYGYMWTGSYSPNSRMATYIQNHNVSSVHSTTTTFAGVQNEINQNYPFPICNLLSTAGHLTLAVGYVNGQHTLIFNDPYGDKNDASWPNYYGKDSYYDWPGYNNGYQNLNTMAWTVTAESSEPVYNDTIIDDVYYNHGFLINNQSPSHMKYFHDMATGGYNNHFWYTYTSASTTIDTCYVKWTPTLPSAGDYEVSVYIPTSNASATAARYKVYYNGGNQTVIINQAPVYGAWVSLGTFPFLAGTSGYVRLGDGTGTASQKIAFDAMKWVNVTQPAAVASFISSSTSVCKGNSVQYTNSSTNATSYSWTFSGGTPSTSTQTNPLVVYSNSGTYSVSLVASGPGGNNTLTMTNYITVNLPATAAFSVSDTLVYLPSPSVTFTNTSTDATSYNWNFGDGATSSSQNPNHTYSAAGDYTVTLIAYNSQCGNDTIIKIIHILNPAPIASFSASSITVCEGSSVQFTSTSTNATNYNWTFTGGSPATSTLANPLVTYANNGTYTVNLIASGPGGIDTMNIQNYITVNTSPVAVFSATDIMVYIPGGNAVFANSSTDATSYVWNFGDGQTSTDFQPWHTYASQGDYTVTLVAHNALCGNDTLVFTDYIHVVDVTGVSQYENNVFTVTLNPNPSDGIINLNIKGIEDNLNLKIFNIEGQLVYSTMISADANNYSDIINLKGYKKGMYYLELRNENTVKVEKIVLY